MKRKNIQDSNSLVISSNPVNSNSDSTLELQPLKVSHDHQPVTLPSYDSVVVKALVPEVTSNHQQERHDSNENKLFDPFFEESLIIRPKEMLNQGSDISDVDNERIFGRHYLELRNYILKTNSGDIAIIPDQVTIYIENKKRTHDSVLDGDFSILEAKALKNTLEAYSYDMRTKID
jgi:hypothetical protein